MRAFGSGLTLLLFIWCYFGCDRLKKSTPLIDAIRARDFKRAKALLDGGADIHATVRDGSTPLLAAAQVGNLKWVRLLVQKGAKVKVRDSSGKSPLLYSIEGGKYAIIRYLIEKGADARELLKHESFAPFHTVCYGAKSPAKELKYYLGLGLDVNQKRIGRTALGCAAEHGMLGYVKLLLKQGAKVDAKDDKGKTPLHYAAGGTHSARPYEEISAALLKQGAKVDAKDDKGKTPLHYAVSAVRPETASVRIVKLLLNKGARANAKDNKGKDPYFYYVYSKHHILRPLVEFLSGQKGVRLEGNKSLYPIRCRSKKGNAAIFRCITPAKKPLPSAPPKKRK